MNLAPNEDEFEVSLFGPGIGESLVIHLGFGDWVIVDSCLNENNRPVSLEYLSSIGVEAATQVRLVVATHWHDDHVRGISEVLQVAETAKFACSAALQKQEFLMMVEAAKLVSILDENPGTTEFSKIFEILQSRSLGKKLKGPDHWASHCMRIFLGSGSETTELWALSPSAASIADALAANFPNAGEIIRRFVPAGPNQSSIVLLMRAAGAHVLLGGDLESTADNNRGWKAVIASSERPKGPSCTYKVAHHGSKNADEDGIWHSLLEPSPVAIVAPYARGCNPLPSEGDIKRILNKTPNAYCTVFPPTKTASNHGPVDKTMNEVSLSRRQLRSKPGHIRVRVPIADPSNLSVELLDGAVKLQS